MTTAEKAIIIHRERIKPSSPTPANKNILKLSLLDVFVPDVYVPLILVYPFSDEKTTTTGSKSRQLKTSLSKTLSLFYPLAGEVIDDSYVDCNDSGVEFIEANSQCCLSDYFLRTPPDVEIMQQFLPVPAFQPGKKAIDVAAYSLLLVQATYFKCGGLVMGICVSHRVADATTLVTFLKCWSSITLHGHAKEEMIPMFMEDSLHPQLGFSILAKEIKYGYEERNYETRRFVFEPNKIEALKAKATNLNMLGTNPTSVEVVTALIWKCASKASRAVDSGPTTALLLAVNMRKRFVPPLPQRYSGNLVWSAFLMVHQDPNSEIDELINLASEIKKEIQIISDEVGRNKESFTSQYVAEKCIGWAKDMQSSDAERYMVSSWCKLDLYGVDFGWGKPAWLSLAKCSLKENLIVLIDTKDGKGIEAWVCLEKDVMPLFESDSEILEFAKLNPAVTFS